MEEIGREWGGGEVGREAWRLPSCTIRDLLINPPSSSSTPFLESKNNKDAEIIRGQSAKRLLHIFGVPQTGEFPREELVKFGLGTKRSVLDYFEYTGGVDLANVRGKPWEDIATSRESVGSSTGMSLLPHRGSLATATVSASLGCHTRTPSCLRRA